MAEISTIAVITAKPGAADQVERVLRELAEATHGEPGCIRYSLQRAIEDPNVFITIEKWDSAQSLQGHFDEPHAQVALAAVGELLALPPQIISAAPLDAGDPAKRAF